MHLHRWSNWQDVKIGDEAETTALHAGIILVRQVIKQQRRCSVCNLVKTRVS